MLRSIYHKLTISSICFILSIHLVAFFLIRNSRLIIDEGYHYDQIMRFVRHDWSLTEGLSIIPGYHFLLSLILQAIGSTDISIMRFVSFVFSLLSILVFFTIAWSIEKKSATIRTIQYSFFPLMFPFFPLLYTDIFSVFVILTVLFMVLKKRYHLAGFIGTLSLLFRQNNIAWLLFLHGLFYLQEYGFQVKNFFSRKFISNSAFFIIGYILFLVFTLVNKGFATGGKLWQPVSFFHFTNIYFILFLFFFLFLPANLANFAKIVKVIAREKKILLTLPLLTLFIVVTLTNNHPWNQYQHFLRNKLLIFFTNDLYLKTVFAIFVIHTLLSLCETKMMSKSYYLLYPVTVLSLLPIWLVEGRYYFIPFTFFLLFRKQEKGLVEYVLTVLFFISSMVLFEGVLHWKFFL